MVLRIKTARKTKGSCYLQSVKGERDYAQEFPVEKPARHQTRSCLGSRPHRVWRSARSRPTRLNLADFGGPFWAVLITDFDRVWIIRLRGLNRFE